MFLPGYSWNIAKIGIKCQAINENRTKNATLNFTHHTQLEVAPIYFVNKQNTSINEYVTSFILKRFHTYHMLTKAK